jgi:capsule polysaccharide export protein KpsE/RkpR
MTEIFKHDPEIVPAPPEPPRAAEYALTTFDLLAQHRRQLTRLVIAAIALFAVIAFLIPKRYEATARLMPPDAGNTTSAMMGALMSRSDLLSAAGPDILGLRTPGATVVGVLGSRTVADDLINQFDLRKVYGEQRYDDARKILARRSDISEDKKSGIITISVQDRDPRRSAQLARAYVDDLNRRIENLSTSAARREREFLEQRLQAVKTQLDEATLRLSKFSSKNMTFDPQIQGKAMLEAASTLQGQLIAAETELSGLQQIYGPENARVKSASARVGELRAKLRTVSGARGTSGELGPSLEQLPLLGNTYYDLARQAKIDETVYEVLTKQYELAKVQEAKEVPSIRVLDEPVVPEKKVWPPRLVIIIFGTLMTLLLAILYYMARAGFERLAPEDPRRILLQRIGAAVKLPGIAYRAVQ